MNNTFRLFGQGIENELGLPVEDRPYSAHLPAFSAPFVSPSNEVGQVPPLHVLRYLIEQAPRHSVGSPASEPEAFARRVKALAPFVPRAIPDDDRGEGAALDFRLYLHHAREALALPREAIPAPPDVLDEVFSSTEGLWAFDSEGRTLDRAHEEARREKAAAEARARAEQAALMAPNTKTLDELGLVCLAVEIEMFAQDGMGFFVAPGAMGVNRDLAAWSDDDTFFFLIRPAVEGLGLTPGRFSRPAKGWVPSGDFVPPLCAVDVEPRVVTPSPAAYATFRALHERVRAEKVDVSASFDLRTAEGRYRRDLFLAFARQLGDRMFKGPDTAIYRHLFCQFGARAMRLHPRIVEADFARIAEPYAKKRTVPREETKYFFRGEEISESEVQFSPWGEAYLAQQDGTVEYVEKRTTTWHEEVPVPIDIALFVRAAVDGRRPFLALGPETIDVPALDLRASVRAAVAGLSRVLPGDVEAALRARGVISDRPTTKEQIAIKEALESDGWRRMQETKEDGTRPRVWVRKEVDS